MAARYPQVRVGGVFVDGGHGRVANVIAADAEQGG